MSKKNVVLRIDWREDDGVLDVARKHDEVQEVKLDELDVGDIMVEEPNGDGVVVYERKSVSDFANSMMDSDDHLRDQVERLEKATDDSPRILIEGNMDDFETLQYSRVKAKSLRGFVASLEERNWAKIKFCSDRERLVDYAVRASRKQFEGESSSLRVQTAVKDEEPAVKRMYGCINGVGPAMADKLYGEYSSLRKILDASTSDLMDIEGVGEKMAIRIQEQLNGHGTEQVT